MLKILSLKDVKKIANKLRGKKKIFLAHGVFDIIHVGHIKYFKEIKKKNEDSILIVTITADKYVNKGPGRPMFNQFYRSEMLSNLSLVDYVVIINDFTAVPAIRNIKPDIYFKGKEYQNSKDDLNLKLERKALNKVSSKIEFVDTKKFSSSEIINNIYSQADVKYKNFLKAFNKEFNQNKIEKILSSFKELKIAVIGEAILDEYIYIKPLNKSPKENLITNLLERKQIFAGGSLAVANNLSSFCKNITLYSLLGKKPNYKNFIKSSLKNNIKSEIIYSEDFKTIKKTRYIEDSYSTKKLFSVYEMKNSILGNKDENKIFSLLKKNLSKYDLVIVNDFGHELFTKKLINLIINNSKFLALNVQTNSANLPFNPVTKFKKADFVSIDIPEAKIASGNKHMSKVEMFKKILSVSQFKQIVFTEGKKGSWFFRNNKSINTPIFNQNVVDTMGAGDAFFAISSLVMKKTNNIKLACFLGNVAGALKVSIEGHSKSINRDDFVKYLKTLIIN